MNEWMKLYLISGLIWWGWLDLEEKYANKPRKKRTKKKTKQINKTIEKEREIQKLIYSIKPKITWHSYLQYNAQLFNRT